MMTATITCPVPNPGPYHRPIGETMTNGDPRAVARQAAMGFATGLVGTAAMTTTTYLQGRLRSTVEIPVDYDATGHVVTAAGSVLGHQPETRRGRTALFLLVHWGYGSAMATGHRALASRLPAGPAAAVFFVGCQSMAFTLFPLVGDTPAPWRWRRDVMASSLAHHLVYVAAVALSDRWTQTRWSE